MLNTVVTLPRKISRKFSWEIKKWNYKRTESNLNKKIRFSHVTYPIIGNAGDTVLSQCVRREFEYNIDDLGWNLIEVNKPVTEHIIRKINKTKALIIGGGGLFLPDTNSNNISGWQWAISKELLQQIQTPVFVYSVGYNYFPGQKPSDFFKENLLYLCDKASFVGLRNYGSINAVQDMLPEDLAKKIVYQPCTTTLIRKIYGGKLPPKKETHKVAFNLAFDRENRRFGNYKDQICMAIAMSAKEIEQKGYEIFVSCHCNDDAKIMPYMNACNVNAHVVNLSRKLPMHVFEFYNEMDCVLGMRGHAQMIPFGLNCDIISLGTHNKLKWFLDDIDATDWYINIMENKDCLRDTIIEKFEKIHENNPGNTHQRLLDAQEKLWIVTENNMKEIIEDINL